MFRTLLLMTLSLSTAAFADVPPPPVATPTVERLTAEIRKDAAIIARRHSGMLHQFLGGAVHINLEVNEIVLVGKVDCPEFARCMPPMMLFRLDSVYTDRGGAIVYSGSYPTLITTFPNQLSEMTIEIRDNRDLMKRPTMEAIAAVTEIAVTTTPVDYRLPVPVTSTLLATELK